MKKSLLALFAVAIVLSMAVPSTASAEGAHNGIDVIFCGQISHGSRPMTSPHEMEIEIYHYVEDEEIIDGRYAKKLGENGDFEINAINVDLSKAYYIDIKEVGYSVLTLPDTITKEKKTDLYRINIDPDKIKSNRYELTSENHYIVMQAASGSLKGKIASASGDNPPLNGVKVTISSDDGNEEQWTFTHTDGSFYFDKVGIGTYKLTAECKGFNFYNSEDHITVNTGEQTIPTIKMTPKNDIDTSHWMSIIGTIAAIALLLAAVVHTIRLKRRKVVC